MAFDLGLVDLDAFDRVVDLAVLVDLAADLAVEAVADEGVHGLGMAFLVDRVLHDLADELLLGALDALLGDREGLDVQDGAVPGLNGERAVHAGLAAADHASEII